MPTTTPVTTTTTAPADTPQAPVKKRTPQATEKLNAVKVVPGKAPVKKAAAKKAPLKKAAVKKASVKKTAATKAAPTAPLSKTMVPPKPRQSVKQKKPKLVRDSFTIPKAEFMVLGELKQRADKLGHPAKKSELLRAGIKILATQSDVALLTALAQVPTIKTGRPASKM